MSDLITDEMVETAARAAYNSGSGGYNLWAHATIYEEEMYLEEARAALEAAAPAIAAAALREAADDIEAYGHSREWAWTVGEVKVAIRCAARLRADRIAGES